MNLKSIASIILTGCICLKVSGQRGIKGAYEGELITPKCLLIIDEKTDSLIKGRVYIDQMNHFPLWGIMSKSSIRGTIMATPDYGDVQVFTGVLKKDTVKLTLISSIDSSSHTYRMLKVSNSVSYNPEKTFGKIVSQFDPMLVGKWSLVCSLKANGDTIKSKLSSITIEYLKNGGYDFYSPELDKQQSKLSPNQYRPPTTTWHTFQGKLTTKTRFNVTPEIREKIDKLGVPPPPEEVETAYSYQIKGDTLITVSDRFIKQIYIKQ